jgi:hypothetical protein
VVFVPSAPAVLSADDSAASREQPEPGGVRRQNPVSFSTSPIAPNGESGWFKGSAPTVTLTAIDPEAPALATYDWGVNPPVSLYAHTFTAPSGENTLYFLSRDPTQDVETVGAQLFKVDTNVAAPVMTTPLGDVGSPAPVGAVVDLAATATDAVSGVGSVSFFYYERVGGAWNAVGSLIGSIQTRAAQENTYFESWNTLLVPDGLYKVEAQVRDVAGNTNFSASQFVRVDNSLSPASTAPRPR